MLAALLAVLLLLLGLLLELLAAALLTALLALLATRRQELARLRVTRALLGDLVHLLAELLGVALVLGALVGAAALLARPSGLLAGGLLGGRNESLLLLGRL